eukprot:3247578-Pyramimonas_sp.AAC.1
MLSGELLERKGWPSIVGTCLGFFICTLVKGAAARPETTRNFLLDTWDLTFRTWMPPPQSLSFSHTSLQRYAQEKPGAVA